MPVKVIVTLIGTAAGQQVTLLKVKGRHTNVLSKYFVHRHQKLLKVILVPINVKYFNVQNTENLEEVYLDAGTDIDDHQYVSNQVVADCRYNVLLGTLWHVSCNQKMDYATSFLRAGGNVLPSVWDNNSSSKAHNLKVGDSGCFFARRRRTLKILWCIKLIR